MRRFRLDVGESHGAQIKNIVGAIANEAGIPSRNIRKVEIHAEHSTVELPANLQPSVLQHLQRVWVSGRPLQITPAEGTASAARAPARRRRQAAAVTVAGAVRAVAAGSLQVAPASGPVVTLLLGRHPRVRLAQKGSRPQPASMAQVRVGASVRIRARQTKKGLVAHSLLVLG